MTRYTNGKSDWNRFRDFHLDEPDEPVEDLCIHAQQLKAWADEICALVLKEPTHLGINQATLLLTHQYFSIRAKAPKDHQEHVSDRGHICIYRIFVRAFHRLETKRLRLDPPVLVAPPEIQPERVVRARRFSLDHFVDEDTLSTSA